MENFDQLELDKFTELADQWWDPNGKFKPLHLINPLRAEYIEKKVALRDSRVLDIGCGGGILSEASESIPPPHPISSTLESLKATFFSIYSALSGLMRCNGLNFPLGSHH